MSTAAERKASIEEQKATGAYELGPKRLPREISFKDRSGNIVRPTRENPWPTYTGGKYAGGKKHYDSSRAYGSNNQYGSRHEHYNYSSSQGLSGMLSIVGIFVGIFFLSNNVTGNVIGLSRGTSSWIGGILILVGLIALGFWIRNRKLLRVSASKKRKK